MARRKRFIARLGSRFIGIDLSTRRSLVLVLFSLLVFASAAAAPWLRPALSQDITGLQLSLLPSQDDVFLPKEIRSGPRPSPPLSIGLLLIGGAAAGFWWVLSFPRRPNVIAGGLLCIASACVASAVFNHPQLIELLDAEVEERRLIAKFAGKIDIELLISPSNARYTDPVFSAGPSGGLLHGARYLLLGPWLVGFSAALLLATARGPFRLRLTRLLAWSLVAATVAVLTGAQRSFADLYLHQAERFEELGELADAEHALRSSVEIFPNLEHISRTWTLAGKLDLQRNRDTPQADYVRARQLADNNETATAIGLLESGSAATGDAWSPAGNLLYRLLMQRAWIYFNDEVWAAAYTTFQKALRFAPGRCGSGFFLGLLSAEVVHEPPEVVRARFGPCLEHTADRALRADMLALLGDASFEAGLFADARELYVASLRAFSLPKQINYRAQRGLSGR